MAQAGAHDVRHDVSKTLCFALLCANRIVHPLSNPSKISPFPSHPQQTKRPNTTSPAVHCTPEDTARRIIQNRQQTYKQNLHKCTETSRSKKHHIPSNKYMTLEHIGHLEPLKILIYGDHRPRNLVTGAKD
jgi:hypothetical protein